MSGHQPSTSRKGGGGGGRRTMNHPDLVELEQRLTEEVDEDFFQDPKKFRTLHRVIDVLGAQLLNSPDGELNTRQTSDFDSYHRNNPAYITMERQQKVVEETVQEVVEETVQENVQETVQETVQEESDLEEDPVDIAAGVGLSESEIATGDAMVDDEEDGDSSAIDCSFEGVSYTRDSNNVVFDDDFDDVGKWVDGAIVFDKFGIKSHKKALAQL